MHDSVDAALLNTTSGGLGYWFGGFIFPLLIAYIFLRLAGSPKRKPLTGVVLRILAVAITAVIVFAAYVGSGGAINPGGILALVVVLGWAAKQQFSRVAA